MDGDALAITGADVFDGKTRISDRAVLIEKGLITAIVGADDIPNGTARYVCDGGVVAPGFVDLQVNGGGGVLFNNAPVLGALQVMAQAHASIGTTAFLPTLITDTRDTMAAAVDAVEAAIQTEVPGIVGLHLEGPHLSGTRRGAHQEALIRPMNDGDLAFMLEAAQRLPALMVTVAPENVSNEQIEAMHRAGIVVSLGHTDADFAACRAATDSGVTCVTHLFNAMGPLRNREPGVVGAALISDDLFAGVIADFVHVHPATIALVLRAKRDAGKVFLVTDAMATLGSDLESFTLNGREIRRRGESLTLVDGTLAGAHVDMAQSIRNLVSEVDVPVEDALAMATSVPARAIGLDNSVGHLGAGRNADLVHLDGAGRLAAVWQRGEPREVYCG